MDFNCEYRGTANEIDMEPNVLRPGIIAKWEDSLPAELAHNLKFRFKSVAGETEEGTKFRTLFVTTMGRKSLLEMTTNGVELESDILELYEDLVASTLETIYENFNVLGSLAEPSFMKLAMYDLSQPFAVFCFVTVEDTPDFNTKLEELGLSRLTAEGDVDTIKGQTW